MAVVPAAGQDQPTPTPTPTPTPQVIPGVLPERFRLPGAAAPTPTSTPDTTPIPAPVLVAVPTPSPRAPQPRAVPTPESAPDAPQRPAVALISAHPDQDRAIAGFHAGSAGLVAAPAFDLPPSGNRRLPLRLTLPWERIHVVQLRGRPMFIGLVMLDLRWRAGLAIRRTGADFLMGSRGEGDRPGPIWLDRPAPTALAAIAYTPDNA
ncbi:hypothetical protein [Sphingomonas elodea]|uniref:hypothetical protein n=1 Tax=Sphingomonas elodea TaxID=179878 RepID=UPI00030C267F|nr:hypothetical protein [Sphingomonas elodea]